MTLRRGFGDQAWELARRGDVAGLERAADLHLRDATGIEYEGRRARAFALAVQGRTGEALQELNAGWTDEWPSSSAYAIDVARLHYLGGNCSAALTALQLDLRTLDPLDGSAELAVACARRDPSVRRDALRLVARSSRGTARLRSVARILTARADATQAGIESTIFPS